MPHHRSPRRHHRLRRRLARERFGTNRQHPATKKERVIYAPEIVIYCRPFTLVLLAVFSQCSLSVYRILPNTLHTCYLFLLANFYQLYSPLFRNLQQAAENFDNPILQQPAEKVIDQIIPMFKTILNCCLAFHGRTIRK